MPAVTRPDRRPQGQPTRGKTTRNRLRRVDTFLLMYDRPLLQRHDGPFIHAFFVDLGFGAEPITTQESAFRLRRANPALPVLGVEIDPERVARALPLTDERTFFRVGGFNLPLVEGETARIIRAFNVLRQYEESEVEGAWQTMGRCLLLGGLLLEGTSDPYGRVWVANVLRRAATSLIYEGLLFSTNFRGGFSPSIFQPVLPKNCIHRMVPGEKIHDFIQAWDRAALETIGHKDSGARQWFAASAHALAARGVAVLSNRRFLRQGYLMWKDSPGEHHIDLGL